MQLWVSKLNKNKWKIALIILSVALVTSCIFGFTYAWYDSSEGDATANIGMDVNYVDIFAEGSEIQEELIPAKYYDVKNVPQVVVNETEGTYCVFVQIKESGVNYAAQKDEPGFKDYYSYIYYQLADGWKRLSDLDKYGFSEGGDNELLVYYYKIIDAAQVDELDVFKPIDNEDNLNNAYFQAHPERTLEQVQKVTDTIKLSVVAAGCRTTAKAGEQTLPTVDEVALSEAYTAFF